jgi:Mlc titration factor MtfA (ptsG expression regulator)
MFGFFRERRRRRLAATPLPEAWWDIIDRRVPLVRWLHDDDRRRLGGILRVFLDEKRFEGCGGLEINDEIRVTIGAQAALLVLRRPGDFYPGLRSILVYPTAYRARVLDEDELGLVTDDDEVRQGEAWMEGSMVLSWEDALRGAMREDDGRNVVLHEFAHLLDGQWADMDGAPVLGDPAKYAEWARVLGREFERLVERVDRGGRSLIDPYGATHPAEFFAVATELFFERPHAMHRRHPDLYSQLADFYRQDPVAEGRDADPA